MRNLSLWYCFTTEFCTKAISDPNIRVREGKKYCRNLCIFEKSHLKSSKPSIALQMRFPPFNGSYDVPNLAFIVFYGFSSNNCQLRSRPLPFHLFYCRESSISLFCIRVPKQLLKKVTATSVWSRESERIYFNSAPLSHLMEERWLGLLTHLSPEKAVGTVCRATTVGQANTLQMSCEKGERNRRSNNQLDWIA